MHTIILTLPKTTSFALLQEPRRQLTDQHEVLANVFAEKIGYFSNNQYAYALKESLHGYLTQISLVNASIRQQHDPGNLTI